MSFLRWRAGWTTPAGLRFASAVTFAYRSQALDVAEARGSDACAIGHGSRADGLPVDYQTGEERTYVSARVALASTPWAFKEAMP